MDVTSLPDEEMESQRERRRRLAPALFLATLAAPVGGIVFLALVLTFQLMYATTQAADGTRSVPEILESLPGKPIIGPVTLQHLTGFFFWQCAVAWGAFYGTRQAAEEWRSIAVWIAGFYSLVAVIVIVATGGFFVFNLLRLAALAPSAFIGAMFAAALKGKLHFTSANRSGRIRLGRN